MIPSILGVLEGDAAQPAAPKRLNKDGDAEMADEGESPELRYISGRTEIGRFREHLRIQPLYQEDGMSKYIL